MTSGSHFRLRRNSDDSFKILGCQTLWALSVLLLGLRTRVHFDSLSHVRLTQSYASRYRSRLPQRPCLPLSLLFYYRNLVRVTGEIAIPHPTSRSMVQFPPLHTVLRGAGKALQSVRLIGEEESSCPPRKWRTDAGDQSAARTLPHGRGKEIRDYPGSGRPGKKGAAASNQLCQLTRKYNTTRR
jgi:hypothetical protein